jgi:hypothetical protein
MHGVTERAWVFVALAAGAVLMAAAGASGGASQHAPAARAGILFTERGASPVESGLWLVTPAGRRTRLLARRWTPWARSRTGVIAASRSRRAGGALWLLSRRRPVQIPGSVGASCVSWSSDGRLLAYVTGKTVIYAKLPRGQAAWGRVGGVWVARASAPRHPLRIATGLSAGKDCPVWSASGERLAYMIRTDPASGPWTLNVYRGGLSRWVATLRAAVPAVDHQTYGWAPDKAEVVFVDGTSLYSYGSAATNVLGQPGSLDSVQALSASRGYDVSDPHVAFSPNGRFIAAGISGATGVFRRDGSPVRVVGGGFNGWAGNTGVLTVAADVVAGGQRSVIDLRLHPLDGSPARVIATHFKLDVAADPAGHWFAYFTPTYPWSSLVFRSPDGTLIRRMRSLRFVPNLVAAVSADGRTTPPVGPSPWSR